MSIGPSIWTSTDPTWRSSSSSSSVRVSSGRQVPNRYRLRPGYSDPCDNPGSDESFRRVPELCDPDRERPGRTRSAARVPSRPGCTVPGLATLSAHLCHRRPGRHSNRRRDPAPGRVAHGEPHAYDVYWAETELRRPDGTLMFSDVLRLARARRTRIGHSVRSAPTTSPRPCMSFQPCEPADLLGLIREALVDSTDVLTGVSELPNRAESRKLLGFTSQAVQASLRMAWNAARVELVGAPAPNLRKG